MPGCLALRPSWEVGRLAFQSHQQWKAWLKGLMGFLDDLYIPDEVEQVFCCSFICALSEWHILHYHFLSLETPTSYTRWLMLLPDHSKMKGNHLEHRR